MSPESFRGDASTISSGLLSDVRRGNDLAWRRMVHLYGPLVYHWSRSAGLQPADATEIVQDVFCSVLSGIQTFERTRKNHSFRGWLRTITKNKIRDEARRKKRMPALPGDVDGADEDDALLGKNPDQSVDSPTLRMLSQALDAIRPDFSDKTWQAFYRATVQGHAAGDIGEDLNMTAKAVRQAKYRVLLRLREELEPEF